MRPPFPERTLGTGSKNQTRCFQVAWYTKHPWSWLHLCASNFKVYCSVCVTTSGTKGDKAFTQEGFNNWKKATKALMCWIEHEQGLPHNTALYASNFNTNKQSISGKLIFHYQKLNNNERTVSWKRWKLFDFFFDSACHSVATRTKKEIFNNFSRSALMSISGLTTGGTYHVT